MELDARETVVIACLVLFLGKYLNGKVAFFREYNIPEPVTGGVLFSIFFGIIYYIFGLEASFALELRDALLIIFFITIGLSSRLQTLLKGGRALVVLLVAAVAYLFIQNFTGIGVAYLTGLDPVVGILTGSISFSGGHGTTIAWVPIFQQEYGLTNAAEIGIACATFGLVMGGLIGGPIAKFLITRNKLQPKEGKPLTVGVEHEQENIQIDYNKALNTIFVIFFTAGVGIMFRDLLALAGLQLPLFVTSLFGGIVVTNLIPVLFKKIKWNPEASNSLAMAADLSLGLFLAMSLMSLQLWSVVDLAGTLIFIVIAQVTVITVFVILVVFWLMGRDYDAAVMSAGYSGLALGATPTAIANMTAVTQKFGGAPRAFIIVPLVGAFFIDIANALIIKYLLSLFG